MELELGILDWIQLHLRCGFLDWLMPFVSGLSNHGEVWILLAAVLLLIRRQRARGLSAAFALALGLPLHLGVPPFITGSKLVTKVLTEDMVGLTGGRVIVDGNGKSAANTLEAIIEEKRKALNI